MKNIYLLSNQTKTSVSRRLDAISLPSRCRVMPIILLFLTAFSLHAWGADTWNKVTSAPADWSGEYLLVYESSSTAGVAWTGVDAANCNVAVTISSGVIATKPSSAVSITIAAMTGGYSIMVNGGTNDGKYIKGASGSNTLGFDNSAQPNEITYENSSVKITSNTSVMRYNSATGNLRFRYFKSTSYSSQKVVQLYKKTSSGGGGGAVDPTITFNNGSYTIGGADLDLTTLFTSNSSGAVTYSVSNANGTGATVSTSGTDFSATTAGTCTVQASQAASGSYNAKTVTATITINAGGGGGNCSVFHETWDNCAGSGGNDGVWSGSVAQATVKEDNSGWSYSSKGGGDACLKVGSSKTAGTATSPSFSVTNGTAYTLNIKAAPWETTASTLTVELTGAKFSDNTTSKTTSDMSTQEWNTFPFDIIATSSSMSIEFSASKNRFFLDEVCVDLAGPTYTVTATVDDPAHGSVSVSGNTITVTPNAGYQVKDSEPYTVTVGTATVTRGTDANSNKFYVTASSDCTVRINFEALPTYKIQFFDNGVKIKEETVALGSTATPPSDPIACDGYTFVGWWTSELPTDNTTAYSWVSDFTVSGVQDYYAVFSSLSGGSNETETISIADVATANSWENATRYSPFTVGDVTITETTGKGDNAKYYSNNNSWRLYSSTTPKGTVQISVAGASVTSVTSSPNKNFTITEGVATFQASSNTQFTSFVVNYSTSTTVYSTTATCVPKWVISFDKNGATSGKEPAVIKVAQGESTTLPGAGNLEKTHYSFKGWNTQPDGLGVTYTAGASFTPTADITLYAKWGENPQYTITWDDGHSDPLPTTSVYAGEKVVLPSDPTSCDPSYPHFMGWYTAPEGSLSAPTTSISGTKVTAQTKPNSDTRYYAVFSNGGTVAGSKEYEFNITPSDFTGGGYAANDGEHTSIATATDASGATFQVTWESQNVYLNRAKAQWKAATDTKYTSSIHNITNLGNVTAVEVTATVLDARFDIFSGSTVEPGTSIDFTSGYPFFVIYNWDVTLRYTTNIHIVFTATGGTSAATGYISTCSAPTTWSVSYNANGKPLSVGSEIPSATTGIPEDAEFAVPSNNYISSPGFAQIGWNTDPSATVGLTSVPAQTAGTMITLYAIWQKSQIEVVEVDDDNNIYLDHNFGGSTSATLQQEVTTGTGNTAKDIFFSKYFESTANVKLVALFNGTGHDIDLSGLRIHIPYGSSAPYGDRYIRLDTLMDPVSHPGRSTTLPTGQELIIYSWQPSSSASGCYRDNAILESAADKVDMSTWIPIPYNYAADNGNHALCFGGREAILLERDSSTWGKGWKPIDIIGAMDDSGHSIYPTESPSWGDGSGWNCNSGKSIEDTTEVIGISTNRCLLVRKFSVLDGSKAVSGNIGSGATFSTLCDEWYGKQVKKYNKESGTACEQYAKDNNSAADGFSYIGSYDYNEYRQQYVEVADTKFTATYDETTGFTVLHINPCGPGIAPEDCIEGGLASLACDYLKITVTNSEKTQVLEQLEYKVPIIVSGEKSTNDAIFSSETACETCDVVVLGNATLTKANDGSTGDQPTVHNLMIYPNGTLHIPAPHTYHVSSVQFRVQGEEVPVAKLQGNLQTPDNKVYVSRRINNDDAYFFSLPYNCNIADITWSNGDAATLGDGFKIQEYDAATRANSGSTAGVPGHWKDVTGSTLYTKKGYQIMVNSKKLRELIFPMDIGNSNVTAAENVKINNTDKVTIELHEGTATKNNWNWNFIAQPYVCAMSPMQGDKIKAGWLKYNKGTTEDPGEWVYEDGTNEYFTIYNPSTKTYDQKKWDAISQLDPFVAYFVQGKANGEFQFEQSHRIVSAPARHLAAQAELETEDASIFVGVTLSGNGQSDETSLRIRPDFTDEYVPGYDLQKFTTFYTERPQIYMKTPDFSLAFQAVSDSVAKNTWLPVGVYIRDAGTYTFALNENNPIDEVEAVYLYDKTTGTTTNLLNESYTITTNKQVYTNKRFSLNVILNRRVPQVTTDLIDPSGAPDNMVRKILINGHVYIQRGAAIYDITGKQMLNF